MTSCNILSVWRVPSPVILRQMRYRRSIKRYMFAPASGSREGTMPGAVISALDGHVQRRKRPVGIRHDRIVVGPSDGEAWVVPTDATRRGGVVGMRYPVKDFRVIFKRLKAVA